MSGSSAPPTTDRAAEASNDPDWLAQAWQLESIQAYLEGDVERSVMTAGQMVTVSRRGPRWLLPEALATSAVIAASAGDRERALASADESWALIGASPTALHFASVVPKIGLALVDADQPQRAYDILSRATTDVSIRLGLRPTFTIVINLGWAALGIDRPAEALSWFARSLNSGSHRGLFLAEECVGAACALTSLGHPQAAALLDAADELSSRHALSLTPRMAAHRQAARYLQPPSGDRSLSSRTDEDLAATIGTAAREFAT